MQHGRNPGQTTVIPSTSKLNPECCGIGRARQFVSSGHRLLSTLRKPLPLRIVLYGTGEQRALQPDERRGGHHSGKRNGPDRDDISQVGEGIEAEVTGPTGAGHRKFLAITLAASRAE